MDPELFIAFARLYGCARHLGRFLQSVEVDVMKSLEAGHQAVVQAVEAWVQLEQLEKDVTSMGMLVDFIDIEKMKAAVKQTKLLMRDRAIWKAMGRFRTFLDMKVIHDYLFDFVNSDTTRTSQLRNASYKERDSGLLIPCRVANRSTCNISARSFVSTALGQVQSDMVLDIMGNYHSWEKIVRNVLGNAEDYDMQLVLTNLGRLTIPVAESLLQLPGIVRETKTRRPDATITQDFAELQRILGYDKFVDPLREAVELSNKASLLAIQHSIAAWAGLQTYFEGMKLSDDSTRKLRKLDARLQEDVLFTCYAYLGKDSIADFGMMNHFIRQQCESNTDMLPCMIDELVTKLQTRHSGLQKQVLVQLICSENVWKRVLLNPLLFKQ